MTKQTTPDIRQLASIDCLAKAKWIALVAALLSLAIDAYAIFWLPDYSSADRGVHHTATLFSAMLWTLESALAILALWLLRFAFMRPPQWIATTNPNSSQSIASQKINESGLKLLSKSLLQ